MSLVWRFARRFLSVVHVADAPVLPRPAASTAPSMRAHLTTTSTGADGADGQQTPHLNKKGKL